MKKRIPVASALVLILFAVLLTFQITYNFVEKQYQKKVDTLTKNQSDFSDLSEADALIRENFIGAVNEDALEAGLVKGYLSALSDPYARYLTKDEYRIYLEEKKGIGSGIGARFTYQADSGEIRVYSVFPSSPAAQSGLRKGDVLYKINGEEVSFLGFTKAIRSLSGDPGTKVNITVKRKLAAQVLEMDFTITRREVKLATVSYEKLSETLGYVQLYDVTETTAQEFGDAMDALVSSGVTAVIFDVRNNAGSDVDAVCAMLDRLLPEGVLMRLTDQKGNVREVMSDADSLSLSMAVVMNSATACAPELFAATLRDFSAATLVGETSYGKATLQTSVEMEDGSVLILSNATFAPPASTSFEGVGVIPDVETKAGDESLYLVSKENDAQLQAAIRALAS